MKIVDKPWGRELWIAHTDRYALKIIEFKKGTRSSLQYHQKKHEHIYVDAGSLQVEWENDDGEIETFLLGKTLDMDESELETLAAGMGSLSLEQAEEIGAYIAGQVEQVVANRGDRSK